MLYPDVVAHAQSFARHLELNAATIHDVLRPYESREVVDDEIRRTIEALRSMAEIQQYFLPAPLSQKTATFLPLNLLAYSALLFAFMPAYQSVSVIVRPPQRLQEPFNELFERLEFDRYYPNVLLFDGPREKFLSDHCASASVVLFTGKYENFLRILKVCSKKTLVIANGVGHNPLVVTPSANLDLAVEKTLHVTLFNNGQDCAGPDIILVHSSIVDAYLKILLAKLAQIRCDKDYAHDDVRVGPLFESSSLLDVANLISDMRLKGAEIIYGGQLDLKHNVMYPCVVRAPLRKLQNFRELYCPLLVVAPYEHDSELALYFTHPDYHEKEMYVSVFGRSNYIIGVQGSIILRDRTIHDIERGTEEYGGYGPGASSVAYQGLRIPKPLLIPREIHNFLCPRGQEVFARVSKTKGNWEHEVITAQFQENALRIFGDQLVFAYIFGKFAREKERRSEAVNTLVCVHDLHADRVEQYLDWLFSMHEMFGRIPNFMHPAHIVSFTQLQAAAEQLPFLQLSAAMNEITVYDAMMWCYSLAQPWTGVVNPENIPEEWKGVFPQHSSRLLDSFLDSLRGVILDGSDISRLKPEMPEIPRKEPGVSNFIENLRAQGLESVLKMVPFEKKPIYTEIVHRLVGRRQFMGRSVFSMEGTEDLYHPCFRFGVVAPLPAKP